MRWSVTLTDGLAKFDLGTYDQDQPMKAAKAAKKKFSALINGLTLPQWRMLIHGHENDINLTLDQIK